MPWDATASGSFAVRLYPSNVTPWVHPANGTANGLVDALGLPAPGRTGFERDGDPSTDKTKFNFQVRLDGNIAIPGLLKLTLVDEIT